MSILGGEGLLRAKLAKSEAKTLPTVGQKFNEANGSWLEKTQIEDVLNGQFEWIKEEKTEKRSQLSEAIWHSDLKLAEVTKISGSYWQSFGFQIDDKLYLRPEEALFLIETACVELRYEGVPISIQQGFELLFKDKEELQNYRIYRELKQLGYRVRRSQGRKNFGEIHPLKESKMTTNSVTADAGSVTAVTEAPRGDISKVDCNDIVDTKMAGMVEDTINNAAAETIGDTDTLYKRSESFGGIDSVIIDDGASKNYAGPSSGNDDAAEILDSLDERGDTCAVGMYPEETVASVEDAKQGKGANNQIFRTNGEKSQEIVDDLAPKNYVGENIVTDNFSGLSKNLDEVIKDLPDQKYTKEIMMTHNPVEKTETLSDRLDYSNLGIGTEEEESVLEESENLCEITVETCTNNDSLGEQVTAKRQCEELKALYQPVSKKARGESLSSEVLSCTDSEEECMILGEVDGISLSSSKLGTGLKNERVVSVEIRQSKKQLVKLTDNREEPPGIQLVDYSDKDEAASDTGKHNRGQTLVTEVGKKLNANEVLLVDEVEQSRNLESHFESNESEESQTSSVSEGSSDDECQIIEESSMPSYRCEERNKAVYSQQRENSETSSQNFRLYKVKGDFDGNKSHHDVILISDDEEGMSSGETSESYESTPNFFGADSLWSQTQSCHGFYSPPGGSTFAWSLDIMREVVKSSLPELMPNLNKLDDLKNGIESTSSSDKEELTKKYDSLLFNMSKAAYSSYSAALIRDSVPKTGFYIPQSRKYKWDQSIMWNNIPPELKAEKLFVKALKKKRKYTPSGPKRDKLIENYEKALYSFSEKVYQAYVERKTQKDSASRCQSFQKRMNETHAKGIADEIIDLTSIDDEKERLLSMIPNIAKVAKLVVPAPRKEFIPRNVNVCHSYYAWENNKCTPSTLEDSKTESNLPLLAKPRIPPYFPPPVHPFKVQLTAGMSQAPPFMHTSGINPWAEPRVIPFQLLSFGYNSMHSRYRSPLFHNPSPTQQSQRRRRKRLRRFDRFRSFEGPSHLNQNQTVGADIDDCLSPSNCKSEVESKEILHDLSDGMSESSSQDVNALLSENHGAPKLTWKNYKGKKGCAQVKNEDPSLASEMDDDVLVSSDDSTSV
ncbi:uncharacterized protein LOC136040112 isoform X1 [Artemia franciscana]